ncbi:MAG TPA: hypothetical protein VEV43_00170, partial [Actinomycetota bacterium]|nr:hypothetical protein [Actinomycetota bacterium]
MRRLVGSLVCVLLLMGGATVSSAQTPGPCRWVTDSTTVRDAVLFGVAAPESTNVFAVGARATAQDRAVTLVRHWDGSAWETQPSPNVNRQSNFLNDVAVAPDGTAWAVGERSRLKSKTVVQRYDGTTWRMHQSLNPSEDLNALHGVDVAPSGDVYAAGARWNAKRRYRTMVHRYDGKAWTMAAKKFPGIFWDLDVVAEDDVWAV